MYGCSAATRATATPGRSGRAGAERDAEVLGDAHRVAQEIRRPERVHVLEEARDADGEGEDDAEVDVDVVAPRERDDPRGGQIGVGATERPVEIDVEWHGPGLAPPRGRRQRGRGGDVFNPPSRCCKNDADHAHRACGPARGAMVPGAARRVPASRSPSNRTGTGTVSPACRQPAPGHGHLLRSPPRPLTAGCRSRIRAIVEATVARYGSSHASRMPSRRTSRHTGLTRSATEPWVSWRSCPTRAARVDDPFDPQQNADGGVRHLRELLERRRGRRRPHPAAYNAGLPRSSRPTACRRARRATTSLRRLQLRSLCELRGAAR